METAPLKKFAQFARRSLMEQVSHRMAFVRAEGSLARRENPDAVKTLEKEIKDHGEETVVERVAYVWFNRFCALRFMDVNRYTRIGVVSPADEDTQPEILAEAKMGHVDERMVPEKTARQVFALLNGSAPSPDPQSEAYRLLLVAACNHWNKAMPFLFQRIDDYTELLLPEDLLSPRAVLSHLREVMTPEACRDVEVIGWLYQFYISEKKDEVFAALKKNKKITPENIPAATQLFTPHWIVRYLVENSLGRLWLLNRPGSKLIEQMDYYIRPEQAETEFLRIENPTEIKICDPACGSGHMLTYAFDLLYAIYEEEGYDPAEIPEKILTHNLYGVEIDRRAGELAAFALTMKARGKQRRFFRKGIEPNICVLRNVRFEKGELNPYMDRVGSKGFAEAIVATIHQFEEANNFGALIRPEAGLAEIRAVLEALKGKTDSMDVFLNSTHEKVLRALEQAEYLARKYHVVVANPPYMGSRGMNGRLGAWAKDNFPNSKSDLFAIFIERNLDLVEKNGMVGMITMQSWMFLSSFEALRTQILGQSTLLSMAHLGARAFDSIGGEVVSTTAFVLENANRLDYQGSYVRLVEGNSEAEKNNAIREAAKNQDCGWFYRASAADFKKIPGSPIAYWVSHKIAGTFDEPGLAEVIITEGQNKTANNDKYVRTIWEISRDFTGRDKKWLLYSKGGDYRKWYGNLEYVVDWSDSAIAHYRKSASCRIIGEKYWFREGITWTDITSSGTGFRYLPPNTTFDMSGPTAFFEKEDEIYVYLCLLNSVFVKYMLPTLNPTLHVQLRDIKAMPRLLKATSDSKCIGISQGCVSISKTDWDSYEASLDFQTLPLLTPHQLTNATSCQEPTTHCPLPTVHYPLTTSIQSAYTTLRNHWRKLTQEMQRLEEENNRIFIDAYGLQDELTPDVPLKEITLTCNPHYRYSLGGQWSVASDQEKEEELEKRLLEDTMKEFISYAVGCMFGRYSLDMPGLVLANQGETLEDYQKKLTAHRQLTTNNSPLPTDNSQLTTSNIIPLLDADWFPDDITERFLQFLRVTFGEEHYEENLAFIESALGKPIRKFFLRDFYNDHLRRYKKRPIYWMFSSPKGSFNALVYMHRYRPDTLNVLLNDYLREFRAKLDARKSLLESIGISADAARAEKTKAIKEIEKLNRMIAEVEEYDREILYPLAARRIEIDLDDGVKVNYPKFGAALKKVPGLSDSGS